MSLIECWATINGQLTMDGPLFTTTSGAVVIGQIDSFDNSSIVLDADDERSVLAMAAYTLLELVQDGVGSIYSGYVLNPVEQITARDEHTITLELVPPIAAELNWRRTRLGWNATNWISQIIPQIVSIAPGWTGTYTDTTDFQAAVTFPDLYILGALSQTIQQFNLHARVTKDVNGLATKNVEVGSFGADSGIYIQDIKGGDPERILPDGGIKILANIQRNPNDVRDLRNIVVPKGGGNDPNSLLSLERCWRIVNDPLYINFGRWGSDADSIARTGLPSVFPEYDPNYPISDPENPPTGAFQWYTTPPGQGTLPIPLPTGHTVAIGVRRADGTVPLTEFDATGAVAPGWTPVLNQGWHDTRVITRTSGFDYACYDAASYATWGHKEGPFVDSSLVATDASPLNQEYSSRALYLSTISYFKRYAHPHHTLTCTVPGNSNDLREGDLVHLDIQRSSTSDEGKTTVSFDVADTFRVMKITRNFNGDDPATDDILVSNLGRYDNDDVQQANDQSSQVVTMQLRQGTAFTPIFFGPFADNLDAITPIILPVSMPATLSRWGRCSLRFEFQQFTQGSDTAFTDATAPPIDIETPGQDILLDTPNDLNLSGTFNPDGSGATGTTDGFATDLYVHVYGVGATGATTGTGNYPESGLGNAFGRSGNALDIPVYRNAKAGNAGLDAATTKSTFTAPIAKRILAKGKTIARIAAQSVLAQLPPHNHKLNQKVGKGPIPSAIIFSINGLNVPSSLTLISGARKADGSFTATTEIDDIGPYIDFPGQTIPFQFESIADSSNPTGAGRLLITGTWFGEFGGLAGIIRAG